LTASLFFFAGLLEAAEVFDFLWLGLVFFLAGIQQVYHRPNRSSTEYFQQIGEEDRIDDKTAVIIKHS